MHACLYTLSKGGERVREKGKAEKSRAEQQRGERETRGVGTEREEAGKMERKLTEGIDEQKRE